MSQFLTEYELCPLKNKNVLKISDKTIKISIISSQTGISVVPIIMGDYQLLFKLQRIIIKIYILYSMKPVQQATKPIKSASLILMKKHIEPTSLFNYQLLMLLRHDKMSFGSVLVFPGGKFEKKDQQISAKFKLQSNLQATALRQCFQQTGLYIPNQQLITTQQLDKLSKIKLNYYKQCLSGNDKLQNTGIFSELTQSFPPLKSMVPYLRLITVPIIKRRYDATFYLHKLEEYRYINFLKYAQNEKWIHQLQNIAICQDEFVQYRWMTPSQILRGFMSGETKLAPPQFIMINIMMNFHKYEDFKDYAYNIGNQEHLGLPLAPNVISLIKNKNPQNSAKYPYAATLIGDCQFPYQTAIKTQTCTDLASELEEYRIKSEKIQKRKNRFLFKKPKQFFQDEYDVQSTLPNSILNKFYSYQRLKMELEKHIN